MSEQDQQSQTDGEGQASGQAPSGNASPTSSQGPAGAQGAQQDASAGQAGGQAASGRQQAAGSQSGAASAGSGQARQVDSAQASQQQTQSAGSGQAPAASPGQAGTPGIQAGGYKLSLNEAQRKRLLDDGVLELSEEQYTGGVRQQIDVLKRRATTAERRLAEIAAEQEEAERKALEEQQRYKELYEKEHQAHEAESTARKDDAIRSRFLLTAQSKGVVDPDVAFVIAKSMPTFTSVSLGEDGAVTGIDELVETLVKEKPYLVSQQQPKPHSVGAASNPAPQSPPPPKNLAEAGDRLEQALRTGVT